VIAEGRAQGAGIDEIVAAVRSLVRGLLWRSSSGAGARPPRAGAPVLNHADAFLVGRRKAQRDVARSRLHSVEDELGIAVASTALDTAWIVAPQNIDEARRRDLRERGISAGKSAGRRHAASRPGAPVLPCREPEGVPMGEVVHYRVPLVANARRFSAGHRIRLVLTSDDANESAPSVLQFRHASVGTSALNTVMSSSRLLLPELTA